MAIETVRIQTDPARTARRVVDVTELRADRIRSFAADTAVHLERRGARTYLVAGD